MNNSPPTNQLIISEVWNDLSPYWSVCEKSLLMSTKAANLCLSWCRLEHSKIILIDQDPGIMSSFVQKRRFQRWVENYMSLKGGIEMNDCINEKYPPKLQRFSSTTVYSEHVSVQQGALLQTNKLV